MYTTVCTFGSKDLRKAVLVSMSMFRKPKKIQRRMFCADEDEDGDPEPPSPPVISYERREPKVTKSTPSLSFADEGNLFYVSGWKARILLFNVVLISYSSLYNYLLYWYILRFIIARLTKLCCNKAIVMQSINSFIYYINK